MILFLLLVLAGCSSSSDPGESGQSDTEKIRQVIKNWELAIETQDEDLLEAQFAGELWPGTFISADAIAHMGGLDLLLHDIEIDVGVQGEIATAQFRVYVEEDLGENRSIDWILRKRDAWIIVEEDWGPY